MDQLEIQPWMSEEQRAYIRATDALGAITAQVEAELPPVPSPGDLAALNTYAETRARVQAEHGLFDALNAKLDARWALLDWAKGVLERQVGDSPDLDMGTVLGAFDSAPRHPALLQDLVELCLELNPNAPHEEVIA